MASKKTDTKAKAAPLYKTPVVQGVDSRWWALENPKTQAQSLWAVATTIESDQMSRKSELARYASLYAGRPFQGLGLRQRGRKAGLNLFRQRTLGYNVIRSVIDTISSNIATKRPAALFLTSGGSWEDQEKGQLLTKFVKGLFSSLNMYEIGFKAAVDSFIFGTGAVKFFTSNGRIQVQRVLLEDLLIDEVDALEGTPSQIHIKYYPPREELLEQFADDPEALKAIRMASMVKGATGAEVADRVECLESWRRSTSDKDVGSHVLSLPNHVLFREDWEEDFFPVQVLFWADPVQGQGYYGRGLCEELLGIQWEINKVASQIQRSIEGSIPRVIVQGNATFNMDQLTDEVWSILKVTGPPPQFMTTQSLSPELPAYLEALINRAYQLSGVSQLSSQSIIPAGLKSGKAIETHQEVETKRFLACAQRYERFYMQCSKVVVHLASQLAKEDPSFSVKILDGKRSRDLKWLDVSLERDQYMMEPSPVSSLPDSPSGKLDFVQQMIDSGMIKNPAQGLALLNFADTESFVALETVKVTSLNRIISLILNKGRYNPPTKFHDLALGVTLAQEAVLLAQENERPEDRIALLEQWIQEASDLLDSMTPPAPPPPPMGAPPSGGMPPPQAA